MVRWGRPWFAAGQQQKWSCLLEEGIHSSRQSQHPFIGLLFLASSASLWVLGSQLRVLLFNNIVLQASCVDNTMNGIESLEMPGMRRSKGQKGFHRVPVMCFLTRQHHWFPFSLIFGRQQRQWCLHTEDERLFGTSPSSIPWWLHKYFWPCLLMAFSRGKLLPVLYLLQQACYIFYGPHVGAGPLSKTGKEGWHGAIIKWSLSTEQVLKHKPVRDAQLAMRSNRQGWFMTDSKCCKDWHLCQWKQCGGEHT